MLILKSVPAEEEYFVELNYFLKLKFVSALPFIYLTKLLH